jgi:two-component system LytT family response regulator
MRILIVDDERGARQEMERMLGLLLEHAEISQAGSMREALGIHMTRPLDLLFLDIQMPGGSGFDVLENLPPPVPPVIFTTAHEQFALRAFEVDAVDYLLKPFSEKRLSLALAKHRSREKKPAFLSADDTILLKLDRECRLVPVSGISMITSDGKKSLVHCNGIRGSVTRPLSTFGDQLDPSLFFKASRSTLINLDHVVSFQTSGGKFTALLGNGEKIPLSRRQAGELRKSNRI